MVLTLAACASQHRPPYSSITELAPDCRNAGMHIRYLDSLRTLPVQRGDDQYTYDRTIDLQIERLRHYCL